MAEFLKSKRTSFVNRPVGVVRADTGAKELGQAIAETGNALQEIFWQEAKTQAIKSDVETAKTLPIYNEKNELQYVQPKFSRVGEDKANAILADRYANQLILQSKDTIANFKRNRTANNTFDKEGFDRDVEKYIDGHIKEFQKTRTRPDGSSYNMSTYLPQIIPKIQNIGVLHSNDIQNRRIAYEERVAVQNKKIVIDSKVKELEALQFDYHNTIGTKEDKADELADIKELENEIAVDSKALIGIDNGYSAVGIKELNSRVSLANVRGSIDPLLDKVQDDSTALKYIQQILLTEKISPLAKSYLQETHNFNEADLLRIKNIKEDTNARAEDMKVYAGEVSVKSGVAASLEVKRGQESKANAFATNFKSGNILENTKATRDDFTNFINKELDIDLTIDNLARFDKDQTENLMKILSLPNVNILPTPIYEAFTNDKIMTRYGSQTPDVQKKIAAKFLNLFNNTAFNIGKTDKNRGDPIPKLEISDDDYKRFDMINFYSRITGDPLHAFNMAGQTSAGDADIDVNVLNTGISFGYTVGKPNRSNPNLVADANDVVFQFLSETEIPAPLHKKFASYVRLMLNHKQVKGPDGKETGFTKEAAIGSLNETYKKLYVEDEMVYDIYSNDTKTPTFLSPKRKYPNEYHHSKFVSFVNKIIGTDTVYEGLGEDVFLLPDFRNTSTNTNYYTLVDGNGTPITSKAGNLIEIDTTKVDKELVVETLAFNKKTLNSEFGSKLEQAITTAAKKNNTSVAAIYKMLDDFKINKNNIYTNTATAELFTNQDTFQTRPFGFDLAINDLVAFNHAKKLYHSPTGADMMEESLVGIPSEAKKQFKKSMKTNLDFTQNIASTDLTKEKQRLAKIAQEELNAEVDSFENYKEPAIPFEAIEEFNKGMRSYMRGTKDAVASPNDGDPLFTSEKTKEFYNSIVKPASVTDLGISSSYDDRIFYTKKDSTNPIWKMIYNKMLTNIQKLPKEVANVVKEYITPEVAIEAQNELLSIIEKTSEEEGYNGMPYVDAKTVSVGAGFNIRYLTDDEINLIPSARRRKFLLDARDYMIKNRVGSSNQKVTSEEALNYINKNFRGKSGANFKIITSEESKMIFTYKMMKIYNQFNKEFPRFAEIPATQQSALIDFAYQHGYESHKTNWRKYWASVTSALTTDDLNLRQFFFNRAGFNAIYNYEQFEDVDGSIMITGKTKAVNDFDNFNIPNDRYYTRAEALGFFTESKPTFLSASKKKTNKVFQELTDYTLRGFGL